MRERECLGQIEAARDWLNGKERHHRLELLQDHKAEIPSTGTQYVSVVDLLILALLLSVLNSVLLPDLSNQWLVQKMKGGVKHDLYLFQS